MTQDIFLDWATVAVAVATFCLVVAAIWAGFSARDAGRTAKEAVREGARGVQHQIVLQRAIESQRRVFDLQSRLHSREYVEMATQLFGVIRKFDSDPSAAESYWAETMSDEQRMVVLAVLNFYELVALEYNEEILDRDVANPNLAYTAVTIGSRAEELVAYLRRNNPSAFDELKVLERDHGAAIRKSASRNSTAAAATAPTSSSSSRPKLTRYEDPRAPAPAGEDIHLPGPTIIPLLAAIGITLIVIGATLGVGFSILGAILLTAVAARWIRDTHQAIRSETSSSEP